MMNVTVATFLGNFLDIYQFTIDSNKNNIENSPKRLCFFPCSEFYILAFIIRFVMLLCNLIILLMHSVTCSCGFFSSIK